MVLAKKCQARMSAPESESLAPLDLKNAILYKRLERICRQLSCTIYPPNFSATSPKGTVTFSQHLIFGGLYTGRYRHRLPLGLQGQA
jgi:hypothetical protein